MKNITKVLSAEHQNILKVLDAILIECAELEDGKELEYRFFEKAIDFFKNYVDNYHHAKEEDILFRAMLKQMGNSQCNPIPVMIQEHEAGRDFLKGIENGLTYNNKREVIENSQGYCFLRRDYIKQEDNVIYPMAEQLFSDEQKDWILGKYKLVEASGFTSEKIQGFIAEIIET